MKSTQSYFPVTPSMRDSKTDEVYSNEIVGGPSYREEVALRIYCAMMSNPAYCSTGMTAEKLRSLAWSQADKFLAEADQFLAEGECGLRSEAAKPSPLITCGTPKLVIPSDSAKPAGSTNSFSGTKPLS